MAQRSEHVCCPCQVNKERERRRLAAMAQAATEGRLFSSLQREIEQRAILDAALQGELTALRTAAAHLLRKHDGKTGK